MTAKNLNEESIDKKLDRLIESKKEESKALKKIFESMNQINSGNINNSTKKTKK
jgi:hypothetical protein